MKSLRHFPASLRQWLPSLDFSFDSHAKKLLKEGKRQVQTRIEYIMRYGTIANIDPLNTFRLDLKNMTNVLCAE